MGVERRIRIGGAVQQKEVRVRSRPADDDSGALPRSPVEWICRASLRAEANVSAGNGEYQINQHATVQGKFADGCRFHNLSDAGVRGVKHFASSGDFHSLGHGAKCQRYIQGQFLADFQAQCLLGDSKT